MTYVIGPECIACHECALECPEAAINYVKTKYEIDQGKCTECGTCEDLCNISAVSSIDGPREQAEKHDLKKLSADLVVLGAGGSGVVAAVRAADLSGKKVIVLEKAKKPGGSAWYAGFGASGTRMDLKDGGEDQRSGIVKKTIERFKDRVNPELIRKAIYAPAEFFDWMCGMGDVKEYFEVKEMFGRKMVGLKSRTFFNLKCRDEAIGPGRGGSFVVHKMLEQFERLGITLLTEHRTVKILTDDNGAVSGVLAEDPGGMTQIDCKACIVSTGGFAHNDELLKKYWPWFFTDQEVEPVHRFAAPTNTGDVVALGESAGAFLDYDNFFMNLFGPVHHPFSFCLFKFALEPEIINVNLDGKRYFDEGFFANGAPFIGEQPYRIAYAVMDEDILNLIAERLEKTPDGWIHKDFRKDIEEELKLDTPLKVADTLEELADKCGINRDNFLRTVEQYNKFCETGKDEDFNKKSEALHPIVKPPFYAIYGKMATDGAFGGILVNENTQAFNQDRSGIVPGLYATGDNASGWALRVEGPGDHRQMITNEMSWAVASGFIAGSDAAEHLKTL